MRDERRKKERSKQRQTNKQGKATQHTQVYTMYMYMYVYMHMTCRSQHKVYRRALTGDDGEEEEIVGERDESVVT